MTKLEEEARMRWDWDKRGMVSVGNGVFIECDRALAAAKIDNEAFYRQGVEDARCAYILGAADYELSTARAFYDRENASTRTERDMDMVRRCAAKTIDIINEAFRGARGIARVEIRQRLARLKGTF